MLNLFECKIHLRSSLWLYDVWLHKMWLHLCYRSRCVSFLSAQRWDRGVRRKHDPVDFTRQYGYMKSIIMAGLRRSSGVILTANISKDKPVPKVSVCFILLHWKKRKEKKKNWIHEIFNAPETVSRSPFPSGWWIFLCRLAGRKALNSYLCAFQVPSHCEGCFPVAPQQSWVTDVWVCFSNVCNLMWQRHQTSNADLLLFFF